MLLLVKKAEDLKSLIGTSSNIDSGSKNLFMKGRNICQNMCSLREGKERKVPVIHNKSCDMYAKSHKGRFKCWQCNQRYSTKKLLSLHGRGMYSYITVSIEDNLTFLDIRNF